MKPKVIFPPIPCNHFELIFDCTYNNIYDKLIAGKVDEDTRVGALALSWLMLLDSFVNIGLGILLVIGNKRVSFFSVASK